MRESQTTFAARIASGTYSLAGFVGASLAGAGVLQIPVAGASGLALIVLGVALAGSAWHRGRTVLERAEGSSAETPSHSPTSSRNRGRGTIPIAPRLPTR